MPPQGQGQGQGPPPSLQAGGGQRPGGQYVSSTSPFACRASPFVLQPEGQLLSLLPLAGPESRWSEPAISGLPGRPVWGSTRRKLATLSVPERFLVTMAPPHIFYHMHYNFYNNPTTCTHLRSYPLSISDHESLPAKDCWWTTERALPDVIGAASNSTA